MLQMPEIKAKKLKIIVLPAGTTWALQPADVYFNRSFKDLIRKFANKVAGNTTNSRWQFEQICSRYWTCCGINVWHLDSNRF